PLTVVPGLPVAGGPARAARAVGRMTGDGPVEQLVRRAFGELPAAPPLPGLLTHGDWHLGQLVHRDRWLLIDIDDLG
ncbi:phosphotransferase, partial [Nonomuraea sp. NPDC004297]